MKTVNNNRLWIPALMKDLFLENRLDSFDNYETFSNPAINIIENLSNFAIEIASPGMEKNNFSIEVEGDTLKVVSKKAANAEVEEKENDIRFIKREFNYGNFERSFKLPEKIQVDKIQANYENGVLVISLPKMEDKKELKKMVEIS